ncbi:hypothetical protein N7454_003312 [Penicillium verhagenii]|nr:hypothetical protein N7454_003312 [Penicillium verhagenii]
MPLAHLTWLSLVLPIVSADWQYLSRPDLAPPVLKITVPAAPGTESGYIFVAPKQGTGTDAALYGPEQPGPYIFRDDGDLVWSGVGYFSGYIIDLGVVVIDGEPALRAFEGSLDAQHVRMNGHHSVLDNRYQNVAVVGAASHRLVSGHEFNVIDGKTALVEVTVPVPTDLSIYGGDEGQQWIISSGFQGLALQDIHTGDIQLILTEIDIHTRELIFEWYCLDHINPNYSMISLESEGPYNGRSAVNGWHYFLINSVDKDDEGNYLISARHYSAIFKINGTTGEIIWQLGGNHGSTYEIPPGLEFSMQHDARFRFRSPDGSVERISFLDNANGNGNPSDSSGPISKARYIELNNPTKTVSEIWTYPAPGGLFAPSQGNVQFLTNGNSLVNWGQTGVITEYSEEGNIIYQASMDSYPTQGVHSYRAFRSHWTGISSEEPAALALRKQGGGILVWVSWNGDTETRAWKFHLRKIQSDQDDRILGVQTRTGFETKFESNITWSLEVLQQYSIVAEAMNSTEHSIGMSREIRIQDDAPFRAHIDKAQLQVIRNTGSSQERMEL